MSQRLFCFVLLLLVFFFLSFAGLVVGISSLEPFDNGGITVFKCEKVSVHMLNG